MKQSFILAKHKEWIDNANYYQLLKRWRFAKDNDIIFISSTGEYYAKIMNQKM